LVDVPEVRAFVKALPKRWTEWTFFFNQADPSIGLWMSCMAGESFPGVGVVGIDPKTDLANDVTGDCVNFQIFARSRLFCFCGLGAGIRGAASPRKAAAIASFAMENAFARFSVFQSHESCQKSEPAQSPYCFEQ
jgi:hypothetical protein